MQACNASRPQLRSIGRYTPQQCCNICFKRWQHTLPDQDTPKQRLEASTRNNGDPQFSVRRFPDKPDARQNNRKSKVVASLNPVAARPKDLPMPPMFREQPLLKDRYSAPEEERSYNSRTNTTRRLKALRAPFATAFAQNPYAHALATPARACKVSDARLPRSCLLDFHIVTTETNEENGVLTNSLLPLSLAAAMVPKTKTFATQSPEDNMIVAKWQGESASREPTGIASYVIGKQKAIQFITDAKHAWKGTIVSRRLFNTMDTQTLKSLRWKKDMPDFVRSSLQKIVMKRVRHFLLQKTRRDTPGMICEQPGGGSDLQRLNHVDHVSCVLELKSPQRSVAYSKSIAKSPHIPETMWQDVEIGGTDSPNTNESQEQNARREGADSVSSDRVAQRDSEASPVESTKAKVDPSTGLTITHKQQEGFWLEEKSEARFIGTKPLLPPRDPSETYYPTLRYRNRRVPLYNLPQLLGSENLEKMLAGTIFRESSFVMVLVNPSTVDMQIWLMKLHTYVAGSKSEMLDESDL